MSYSGAYCAACGAPALDCGESLGECPAALIDEALWAEEAEEGFEEAAPGLEAEAGEFEAAIAGIDAEIAEYCETIF